MNNAHQEKSRTDSDSVSKSKEKVIVEQSHDFSSPQRILSIDFIKGFAIIFIILAHTSGFWLDSDWIFVHGVAYAFLDILGPSLFVFLSALSVIFSVKKRREQIPEKVIRNRIFTRGITIMIIGIPYNLIAIQLTIEGYPFPLNLWGWNILMFIGFSQIVCYYAVKLSKIVRAFIGSVLIFVSDYIRFLLYINKDLNLFTWILHYLITSPAPQVTLFPWLSICFISTIFGEYLFKAMEKGTRDAFIRLFRLLMFWGILLVTLGITLGLTLYAPETLPGGIAEYTHLELLEIANTQKFIDFVIIGMPEFLIRGRMPNMWYNLGAALLMIGVCFYFIDIKNLSNNFTKMVQYYGTKSLNLFLIHYVFITLFFWQFNIVVYFLVCFGYVGFLGLSMCLWMELLDGLGSPEWIVAQIGRMGQKKRENFLDKELN